MKMRLVSILLIVIAVTLPATAGVQDWSIGGAHVTYIEMKVGNGFRFSVDKQAGPCAANTWLIFDGRFYDSSLRADMVKTVYATILASKLSGQTLVLLGDNTPEVGGCVVGIVNSQ